MMSAAARSRRLSAFMIRCPAVRRPGFGVRVNRQTRILPNTSMLANTSRTDKRAAKVCSALVGHPGITPGGKLYRRSPQWNPCLLGRCSIAPRWEADAIPVSPLGASSLLALRLIVTSRVLHRGQANPACPVLDKSASILLGQHDRDHALGDRRISWIGGVIRKALVVVIDLEEHLVAVGIERAKIVLFVRIVGVAKVVEHR